MPDSLIQVTENYLKCWCQAGLDSESFWDGTVMPGTKPARGAKGSLLLLPLLSFSKYSSVNYVPGTVQTNEYSMVNKYSSPLWSFHSAEGNRFNANSPHMGMSLHIVINDPKK